MTTTTTEKTIRRIANHAKDLECAVTLHDASHGALDDLEGALDCQYDKLGGLNSYQTGGRTRLNTLRIDAMDEIRQAQHRIQLERDGRQPMTIDSLA